MKRTTAPWSCTPFLVIAVIGQLYGVCDADTSERPNVLMIIVDDLNDFAGCLGGYPGESPTPHIDQLAERGMLFTNAHCNAPLCNPSRTSVMTGLHPATTGVHSNRPKWFEAVPQAVPLPTAFHQNGYQAIGCGKVFHTGADHHPEHIWDAFFQMDRDEATKPPQHGIAALAHSTTGDDFDWARQPMDDMQTGDGKTVQWAIDQLKETYSKPLFLAVGIFRPHLPMYAPDAHFDRYPLGSVAIPDVPADDFDDIPHVGRALRAYESEYFDETVRAEKWEEVVQAYLASCSLADALIGRLLKAFEDSPYADNAIIVLWSDHGWHLGEKQKFQKHALWEPASHVPLIVIAPGVTQPGTSSAEAVTLLDLYPTLMDLCGLPVSDQLEGESLRSLLENPEGHRDRPAVITFGVNNHAIRDERWKYIRYHDGSEELYDMKTDPNEWTNRADDEELRPIKNQLSKSFPQHNTPAKSPRTFPNVLPAVP